MQSIKFKLVFCLKVFSLVLSECFDRRSYDDLKFVYDISTMKEKANFLPRLDQIFLLFDVILELSGPIMTMTTRFGKILRDFGNWFRVY